VNCHAQTPPLESPYINKTTSHYTADGDSVVFLLDTINEKIQTDSMNNGVRFYNKLKSKAYKNKITKELYHLFFVTPGKEVIPDDKKREQSSEVFIPYEGKVINKIIIDVIPPFKPNFLDTVQKTRIWMETKANKLHNTSSRKYIKKQLYFKEGDTLDAYNTADNERLIRELPYIKDAQFIPILVMGSPELVDLYLLVKDQFSWGIDLDIGSISSTSVELFNQNLYGRGHEIKGGLEYNRNKSKTFGYLAQYKVKNIRNTHINSQLAYKNNYQKTFIGLAIERLFESYMTKYAGGLSLSKTMDSNKINSNDPILNKEPLDFNSGSLWLGQAFQLKSRKKFAKSRLFTTAGASLINFYKRPEVAKDLNQFFHNYRRYLASITLNQIQYYKSNLIYNFGRTEDIPYGYLMQITTGFEDSEFTYRKYLAFEYQRATHFKKSQTYFFTKLAIGGFFNEDQYEQGTFVFQNKFIGRLRKSGRYRFRNFGELNYTLGIRRFPEEFITLNNTGGIRGYSSLEATGTQRLNLKIENIAFTPFMAGGFRFAFFSFADMGIIGSNQNQPFNNEYYYGLGCGIRLSNENLVFKTIELRFVVYPKAPSDFSSPQYRITGEDRPKFSNFSVGQPKVIDFE